MSNQSTLGILTAARELLIHKDWALTFKKCDDCPPIGYPTDKTRCDECPRRRAIEKARADG